PPLAGGPAKPYISTVPEAEKIENGLPNYAYYKYLTTGGTGLKSGAPDTRIPNVLNLPGGPFQITPGIKYDDYAASPVHRFYQMWQQLDCNINYSSRWNPSGCKADLFPYVEVTIGAGSNGKPQPKPFNYLTTREGSTAMGFYNVLQGDAPYLKSLADHYSMSDNFHQAVMGGTGANHVALGTGDAIWFSDKNFNPATPPHKQLVAAGTANAGVVDEVENPNAAPGTNNFYAEDGYGGGSFGSPSFGGGTYSNCSDSDAPGVGSVLNYLSTLPYQVDPKCAPGHYYLLNNYNPGYFGNGQNAYSDHNKANTVFTIPPSSLRNIGDELLERNVSWKYYGDQWNIYKNDPYQQVVGDTYCNICNFFQYSRNIMTNAKVRTEHLKDTADFYKDITDGTLPAVSYVKPSGLVDGHPASSKLDLFEGFVKKIVDGVHNNPALWKDTAIFVTFDEGGGYYDSGYVQPVDFFGDGTRIPLIVVSPYTKPGAISHDYTDHVSILKFIEKNWELKPLTGRSRDNLPNPKQNGANPYVPTNSPAIGDLMDLFHFNGQAAIQ
ncbi:MAG: alkaline phosphatase family protein, partial [Acidobacteriaceae bacterium]